MPKMLAPVYLRPVGTSGAPLARNGARVMGYLSKRRSPNRARGWSTDVGRFGSSYSPLLLCPIATWRTLVRASSTSQSLRAHSRTGRTRAVSGGRPLLLGERSWGRRCGGSRARVGSRPWRGMASIARLGAALTFGHAERTPSGHGDLSFHRRRGLHASVGRSPDRPGRWAAGPRRHRAGHDRTP